MRPNWPFRAEDLDELDGFLSLAARVVAMEDVFDGARAPNVIGLRHDCDNAHSLETATHMARWEAERGYRSTYFLLHTSPYWWGANFERHVAEIADCGHEIGIHVNALAQSIRTNEDPDVMLMSAIQKLRRLGYAVRGAAGHGDPICLREKAEWEEPFANDEQFAECRREKFGDADREINRGAACMRLQPRPLADFGLEYEALFMGLPWPNRFADSGGRWLEPGFAATVERFEAQADVSAEPRDPTQPKQLHLLIHPDWWEYAFRTQGVVV
jgi:hypothetical protein